MLTLSQPGGGADYAHILALPHLIYCDYAPEYLNENGFHSSFFFFSRPLDIPKEGARSKKILRN